MDLTSKKKIIHSVGSLSPYTNAIFSARIRQAHDEKNFKLNIKIFGAECTEFFFERHLTKSC